MNPFDLGAAATPESDPAGKRAETFTAPEERLTDLGNARRLVRLVGQDLRYVHAWSEWLIWSGSHWIRDQTGAVERYGKKVVEEIHLEAAAESNQDRRKALGKHAIASDSARSIRNMIALAQSEWTVAVPAEAVDRDPWLLNCRNGTLELRTGQLREHRREDLITKCVPAAYDPAAPCPRWEAFLGRIFAGRSALIFFVQRALGYALTGDTREQALFLCCGVGANGKSTLLQTIRTLLSDYSGDLASSTLLARKGDVAISMNDLATLQGVRFVMTAESDMGRSLAEALVKQITGGDSIKVKRLYADVFAMTPAFKVWIATNHKPVIRGTRVAVELIVDLLAQGWSEEEILKNYPGLTHEDLQASLKYASAVMQSEKVYPLISR